jgi:predicted kinase
VSRPTLVVVSGPAGSGKTTLAHALAGVISCPAICRDEIKEGMAHATPGFVPRPGDELTRRTLPVFFEVLRVLLAAGVTTVAEAAFQDPVWRKGLEPLGGLAEIRVVHCAVDPALAEARARRRGARPVHPDALHRGVPFDRVALAVPSIEVDTADGYRPGLGEIAAFVRAAG